MKGKRSKKKAEHQNMERALGEVTGLQKKLAMRKWMEERSWRREGRRPRKQN